MVKLNQLFTTSDDDAQQLAMYRQEALDIEMQHSIDVDVQIFNPHKKMLLSDGIPPVSGDGSFSSCVTGTYESDSSNQHTLLETENNSQNAEITEHSNDCDNVSNSEQSTSEVEYCKEVCPPCESVESHSFSDVCYTPNPVVCEETPTVCHEEEQAVCHDSDESQSHDFHDICYTPNPSVCDAPCVEVPAVCHDVVEVEHHDDCVEHCDAGDHDSGCDAHDSGSSDGGGGSSGDGHS